MIAEASGNAERGGYGAAYTDSPELHRNPVLAALQLAAWLLFHPAAWRGHIARIEPTLTPDFNLAQLTRAHLANRQLRRLLLLGHVLIPLLIGAVLIVGLVALRVPPRFIVIRVLACIILSIGASLLNGTGSSVGVGIASSLMGALTGSAAFIVAVALTGKVAFVLEANVSSLVKEYFAGGAAGYTTLMVAFGVAGGGMSVAVSSVGAGLSVRRSQQSSRPHFGGILIGFLCGAFFFAAATGAAVFLPFAVAISLGGFLAGFVSVAWLTRRWGRALIFATAAALNNYLMVNVVVPMTGDVVVVGIILGIILGAWFGLPYVLAEEIGGTWGGAVGGALGFSGGWLLTLSAASKQYIFLGTHLLPGLISLQVSVLVGLTEPIWRPLLFFPFEEAWNLILLRLDKNQPSRPGRASFLRWHSAFWDQHQRWALYGLDEHLLLVMERNPQEGSAALERLSAGHQRWAAQAAQIEFDAQKLERCDTVTTIGRAHRSLGHGELEGPASALLRRFSGISQDAEAALAQSSAHNQRLGLSTVQQRLDQFISEMDRSSDRYAQRFRPIAVLWKKLVASHVQQLAEAVELHQELDNPYIIGVPLTLEQEMFVGRTDISARIEQLLLDKRRPPLLIYGQRRMGKTSLLNNLGRLLPTTIVPLFVDMQGPASAATDHAGLLYNVGRGMLDSARRQRGLALPPLPRESLTADPFTAFDEWLDKVEAALGSCTALLALDEIDALDGAIQAGRFQETAVLGMLRHIVQHRRRIKILLASSFSLEELTRWSSYMINVQIVQVGYLGDADATQLIEHPVKNMALRYEPQACKRVLALTRGHPFLIQLLCSEIVTLKNEQEPAQRRLATVADVLLAVPAALQHGSFFFADIERNQVGKPAVKILRRLAAQGERAELTRAVLAEQLSDSEFDVAMKQLRLRGLLEPCAGGYRFQVELIERWFAQPVG